MRKIKRFFAKKILDLFQKFAQNSARFVMTVRIGNIQRRAITVIGQRNVCIKFQQSGERKRLKSGFDFCLFVTVQCIYKNWIQQQYEAVFDLPKQQWAN